MASTRYCRLRLPVDTAELKGRHGHLKAHTENSFSRHEVAGLSPSPSLAVVEPPPTMLRRPEADGLNEILPAAAPSGHR